MVMVRVTIGMTLKMTKMIYDGNCNGDDDGDNCNGSNRSYADVDDTEDAGPGPSEWSSTLPDECRSLSSLSSMYYRLQEALH